MNGEDATQSMVRKYSLSKIKKSAAEIHMLTVSPPDDASHTVFCLFVSKEIEEIASKIQACNEPRADVRATLAGLSRIETLGWVLQNLMEAVKRDESFSKTLKRYNSLGIIKLPAATALKPDKEVNSWLSSMGVWRILESIKDQFRRIILRLVGILLNGVKAIGLFIDIKPKPSIGWSGFLPSFSLEVDYDVGSASLYELIDVLLGSSEDE